MNTLSNELSDGTRCIAFLTTYLSGECVLAWRGLSTRSLHCRGLAAGSHRSLCRLRRLIENARRCYRVLVTLTYPARFPDPQTSKVHLKAFVRRVLYREGFPAVQSLIWVLEFQQRSAPHFHLVMDTSFIDAQLVAKTWHAASSGLSSMEAGTRAEAIRADATGIAEYLAKYLSKTESKTDSVQRVTVGRLWGCSGNANFVPPTRKLYVGKTFSANCVADSVLSPKNRAFRGKNFVWMRSGGHVFVDKLSRAGFVPVVECTDGSIRLDPDWCPVDDMG